MTPNLEQEVLRRAPDHGPNKALSKFASAISAFIIELPAKAGKMLPPHKGGRNGEALKKESI